MAVLTLTGCGGGREAVTSLHDPPLEVKLTIDGRPGVQTVGILMAERLGYFTDEGVFVDRLTPVYPGRPIQYVVNRSVDLSISHLPQIALAQQKGAPIIAVGSLIPQPTAAMIWLRKSGIDNLADLKGKTIATPGLPFQKILLETALASVGLGIEDVKLKNARYELLPFLLRGRADAIFGGTWNVEGAELEARSLNPVVTPVRDLDLPDYEELVFFARRDRLMRGPESIRAFMSALVRGTAAASEDPAMALEVILDEEKRLGRKATESALDATLPLLNKSGEMDLERAGELVNWMHSEGIIRREISSSNLVTNAYLPGS